MIPPEVAAWLRDLQAPPRLVRHLEVVHATARSLLDGLRAIWPGLLVDRELVLFGAAVHDLGKCLFPEELTGPGRRHEEAGYELLLELGVPPSRARFARTHGAPAGLELEDLLVALADKIWRGRRDDSLEREVVGKVAVCAGVSAWEAYAGLDELLVGLAEDASERLREQ